MKTAGSVKSVNKNDVSAILKIAILAVGGQGGAVLNNWIIDLAERHGYDVQSTSIVGVAQRTGSTIYYVEMLPKSRRRPVFSLKPVDGDIDIVIAAELMEAGRAVTRGFVTPGKTKVVCSTHRLLATQEKVVFGDGTADGDKVLEVIGEISPSLTAFDMQVIAEQEGTVISASVFGAIAGAGALPFKPDEFRETIRASGHGVKNNIAAFDRAFAIASGKKKPASSAAPTSASTETPKGPARKLEAWKELQARIGALPQSVHATAGAGTRKLIEFQDIVYAADYLDRLEQLAKEDKEAGGSSRGFAFSVNAAKYLANAMAYDDIIRVADAKTRTPRLGRIEAEIGVEEERHLTRVTEYFHPGVAEVVSMFPAGLGRRIRSRPGMMRRIDKAVNRGRRIRTDRIRGFLMLYIIAGLRRFRRSMLRHADEVAHIEDWLLLSRTRLPKDYDFAVETLRCRRLIKGYSDTHARGLSRFDRVMQGTALVAGRNDAADWTRRLIEAALADHNNTELDGALETIRSFAGPGKKQSSKAAGRG
jgi:indolepyruvate ferredoxin oxidoreductase beta subunit